VTVFWIIAAGLLGVALLFILPPLLSHRGQPRITDQDALNLSIFRQQLQELDADLAAGELDRREYKSARRDLERELLYDVGEADAQDTGESGGGRWAAVVLAVAVPAVAVSLYLYLGDSAIIPRLQAAASRQAAVPHPGPGGELPPLEVMVQRLADKLGQNPDNLEGWMMLGRSYFAMGQPARALHAMEQAYGLAPENPDVLITYAEAVAANNKGTLAGRPAELIQTALDIDPRHASARWLQGLASFQDARYSDAAEQWGELEATLDPQSDDMVELRRYIAEARSRAGGPDQAENQAGNRVSTQMGPPSAGEAENAETQLDTLPEAATPALTVEVSLAEPLSPKVEMDDSVFIYAKAVSGPPMPLAAHRARVADLPLTIRLDDSMAIVPAMKLSGFEEVTVGARISKGGQAQAIPASGDLEGEVSPVHPGADERVKVVIDRVRP
jgi:cytochrome c-type biogenesis protein CcmH